MIKRRFDVRFALVAFTVFAAGCFLLGKPDTTGADARALVKAGALLVDVRSPSEFAAGHIEGAINMPHDAITGNEAVLSSHKNADILLYCRSGRRSALTATVLRQAGYTKVHDLGAMSNW